MSKTSIADLDVTAANNTDINAVSIAAGANVSLGDDALRSLAALIARMYDSQGAVAVVSGTDTYTVTITEDWTAYANGMLLAIKPANANTGASTLNVTPSVAAALGAKAIRRQGDSALSAGDMAANGTYLLRYDTAYNSAAGAWVLLNPAQATAASAATVAEVWAGTASTVYIPPSIMQAALAEQTLTDGATVTIDFSAGINFKLDTIGGNRALAASNLTNVIGRTGRIRIKQDATGSRTLSMTASPFVSANGVDLVLSTTANATDLYYYDIVSATQVVLSMSRAIS